MCQRKQPIWLNVKGDISISRLKIQPISTNDMDRQSVENENLGTPQIYCYLVLSQTDTLRSLCDFPAFLVEDNFRRQLTLYALFQAHQWKLSRTTWQPSVSWMDNIQLLKN
jgi:hypothetical protein